VIADWCGDALLVVGSFAPPTEKEEAVRGYYIKFSGLGLISAGFAPSPLRGEGRDEEWFLSST